MGRNDDAPSKDPVDSRPHIYVGVCLYREERTIRSLVRRTIAVVRSRLRSKKTLFILPAKGAMSGRLCV